MKHYYFLIVLSFTLISCASRTYHLPNQLNEISGIDDAFRSAYFSINDSGDGPFVYIMNEDGGSILHKMFVSGTDNIDWEDLSTDGEFLYIGDIGNNRNQRRDLMVYRVPINYSWTFYYNGGKLNHNLPDTVQAEFFVFNYPDQIMFPPEDSQMNFDSEALTYADGKLLILSKDRSKPYKGICKIYEADLSNNMLEVKLLQEIHLKGVSWLTGSVTGCDYLNNKL